MTQNLILACIDGSKYSDIICDYASWASKILDSKIKLLHVQTPHSEKNSKNDDFSGSIGPGSRRSLLNKLAELDEQKGRIDQEEGRLILEHGANILKEDGHAPQTLHLRGSIVETICDLQAKSELIIIGKRGTHAGLAKLHLGSNLERVVRQVNKPLLICSKPFSKIKKFVVAYDASSNSTKIINFLKNNPLLQGLECHLIKIGVNEEKLEKAKDQIEDAGFKVKTKLTQGSPDEEISNYIKKNNIDLLVMGAYGHSKIRNLIIGSTTSQMLYSSEVPILIVK